MRPETKEIIQIVSIPLLAEAVAVILFIAMLAVWAAIGAGA